MTLLLLLVTGALLGVSTNLAKLAGQQGVGALPFLTWSVAGAAIILAALVWGRGHRPPAGVRTGEYFIGAAVLSVAAPNLIFFAAVPHVGASFVSLTIAIPPVLTYAGALLLGMERFRWARGAALALALAGALAIAIPKLRDPTGTGLWVIVTLIGPVLLAAGNLYRSLRWPEGASPESLAPGMLIAAAGLLLLLGLVSGWSLTLPLERPEVLLLVAAQIATFAVQYLLFFQLQQRGGPVYLSLLGSVGAIVAVPVAVGLLGEAPPVGLVPGGLLIAAGVALLTWSNRTAR